MVQCAGVPPYHTGIQSARMKVYLNIECNLLPLLEPIRNRSRQTINSHPTSSAPDLKFSRCSISLTTSSIDHNLASMPAAIAGEVRGVCFGIEG